MLTHIDVNFYIKYEGHLNWSKILSMDILRVFGDDHMWHQNWHQYVWTSLCQFIFLWTSSIVQVLVFRWFKFTLKPPYTVVHGNLLSAIWDTSHWTSFVNFGLKTAWDISYDILWPILKYVNFWRLQHHSSNLSKKDAFRKSIFSRWKSDEALTRLGGFRWAGP